MKHRETVLLLVLTKNNVLLQSSWCSVGCRTDDEDDHDDDDADHDDDDDDDDDDDVTIGRCELELS